MKWDLVVQRWGSGLAVTGFHLSPVSPFVPFNKYAQESLLNYTHSYNIRSFFQKTKGYFWSSGENPDLKGPWPAITSSPLDTHCSFYEAGVSRATYGVHSKQFEMLAPVYLEQIGENQSLQIEIQVLGQDKGVINTCVLDLREDPSKPDFHNRFCRYFRQWLQKTGIQSDGGQKDIMEVNLANKSAWISGIDVTSGDLTQKDVTDSLINNLLYRERPLMETDSILTNIFKDNNLILSQLFNLNICFDTEDIMPANICQMVYGASLNMFVKASIQNISEGSSPEYLPTRDIFSNYDYIPREKLAVTRIHSMETAMGIGGSPSSQSEEDTEEAPNVIDYLQDTNALDLVDKNKIVQGIIHWSLQDNPRYIFNLYGGFGGYYEDADGEIGLISHNYGSTPDPGAQSSSNNIGYSNCLWASLIELYPYQMNALLTPNYSWKPESDAQWEEGIDTPEDEIFEKATDPNTGWLSGYKMLDKPNKNLYRIMLVHIVPTEAGDKSVNNPRYRQIGDSDLYWAESVMDKRLIYIASTSWDSLSWAKASRLINQYFPDELNEEESDDMSLTNMVDLRNLVFNRIQLPELISFSRGLALRKANGPSLKVREIQWVKDDSADPNQNYILRYGGRIVPSLVEEGDGRLRNYIYYKDQISGDEDRSGISPLHRSIYARYIRSGLTPKYPSIGFNSLKKSYEDYSNNPVAPVSNDPDQRLCPGIERKHWRDSSFIILRPQVRFSISLKREDGGEFDSIEVEVRKHLVENIYGLEDGDAKADYIWSLYGYEYDFEYDYSKASESDPQAWKDNYIFNVTATLK